MWFKKGDILKVVAEIYEDHKIKEYGFDPVQLGKEMGYLMLPYSSYSGEKRKLLMKVDKDGFSGLHPAAQKGAIWYNDEINPRLRIKYTIPHELGHLELGHVFNLKTTDQMEEEAKEFARQLYLPQIVLFKDNILTISEIMSCFGVTESYAKTILSRLKYRLDRYGDQFLDEEYRLYNAFDYNRSHRK